MFQYSQHSRSSRSSQSDSKHQSGIKQQPPSSWSQTTIQINRWREQSHLLWILYAQFPKSGSSLYQDPQDPVISDLLQSFCQILMEYLSAAHFQIFEKIAEAYQKCDASAKVVVINPANLFNQVSNTIDLALDFNDKYAKPDNLTELAVDLSALGEMLAHRMDWEDKLVHLYAAVTGEFVESLKPEISPFEIKRQGFRRR